MLVDSEVSFQEVKNKNEIQRFMESKGYPFTKQTINIYNIVPINIYTMIVLSEDMQSVLPLNEEKR